MTDKSCHKCVGNSLTHAEYCPKFDRTEAQQAVEQYRAKMHKAQAPAAPGRFQHLTDEQMAEHLADVNAGIERGDLPF